jgi:hypothetical protein
MFLKRKDPPKEIDGHWTTIAQKVGHLLRQFGQAAMECWSQEELGQCVPFDDLSPAIDIFAHQ